MDARRESEPVIVTNQTTVERRSDRELVITRSFDAPVHIVFEAWTRPELIKQWWAPKSTGMSLVSCEVDLRIGGGYRFEFAHPASKEPLAFFGKYLDVQPDSRLVWTNEESDTGSLTTVTFEERAGKTLLVMQEAHPSKDALDAVLCAMEGGMTESFAQLDEFLVSVDATR